MSRTKRTTPTPITPAAILAALLRDDASNLGELLPVMDAAVPELVARGGEAVTEIVRAHVGGHAKARKALDAAGVPHTLLDRLDDVTFAEIDAAFALGLALGLRMGR